MKNIYFLGIGGIGMSALARYFKLLGKIVSGYDRTQTELTDQLQAEGIEIHFEDNLNLIPENIELVIVTPAIPKSLKELQFLREKEIPVLKRAEALGWITDRKKTIAVSGTHGKTSVSAMIAHILHHSKLGCHAFLGGIAKNYNSNLILSKKTEWVVAEADEFDRSFLHLNPDIEIITSMDADHLDIYGTLQNLTDSFSQFAGKIRKNGILLLKKGLQLNLPDLRDFTCYRYAIDEEADFYATNIILKNGFYQFDLAMPGSVIESIDLGIPGLLNVENAVAAIAAAHLAGAGETEIKSAISKFTGIKRRFDIRFRNDDIVYIDDYAHHPEEIRRTVLSVRQIFPGKKILGVFQPHLYSRTRDFAEDFAKSLGLPDEVILLPIYPAREEPITGISSRTILDFMDQSKSYVSSKAGLLKDLESKIFDILLTMGAGDIDQLVKPIEKYLQQRSKN
ncbi:MAG: UDP-N-acetylmuramate--L-alanine ligase [Bacteroidales bacterium]|nr:UDP-N-acetylmuramate--L-alanine ligase [Bacteroidales bacterium]